MRSTAVISASLLPIVLAASVPAQNFVNTAVARTVELGGLVSQITTQYNVKALVDGPGEYHLALGGEGDSEPAWWEVLVGGTTVQELSQVSDG
jgi:oligosaccharyltransferase complex subunit alpha (ribophorin I)